MEMAKRKPNKMLTNMRRNVIVFAMEKLNRKNVAIHYPTIDKGKTAQRMKSLLEKRGLSVKDVVNQLEIGSRQCVYQWLNGRRLPSIDNLYALAALLEVDISDILCGQEDLR